MIALVENNLGTIRDLCKKHHVKSLYLFGSALNEQLFDQKSDIDFLYDIDTVSFDNWDTGNYDYIDNLNDLEMELQKLLSRRIDLVPNNNIHNRFFREYVDRNRQLVYAV